MPILQSFLLQETFTVDKNQKRYLLETKVLINAVEETVQTLTFGYQPENPYVSYTRIYFILAYQKKLADEWFTVYILRSLHFFSNFF